LARAKFCFDMSPHVFGFVLGGIGLFKSASGEFCKLCYVDYLSAADCYIRQLIRGMHAFDRLRSYFHPLSVKSSRSLLYQATSHSRAHGGRAQVSHVFPSEEALTGFPQRLGELLGLPAMPMSFFLRFNLAWLVIWTVSVPGLRSGQTLARRDSGCIPSSQCRSQGPPHR